MSFVHRFFLPRQTNHFSGILFRLVDARANEMNVPMVSRDWGMLGQMAFGRCGQLLFSGCALVDLYGGLVTDLGIKSTAAWMVAEFLESLAMDGMRWWSHMDSYGFKCAVCT